MLNNSNLTAAGWTHDDHTVCWAVVIECPRLQAGSRRVVGSADSVLPIIPVIDFPGLDNVIVRSHRTFSATNADDVYTVFEDLARYGIDEVSLSVKLECDNDEKTSVEVSIVSGHLLFDDPDPPPSAHNPLPYAPCQTAIDAAKGQRAPRPGRRSCCPPPLQRLSGGGSRQLGPSPTKSICP